MSESKKRGLGTKLDPTSKKYQFPQIEQNSNQRSFFFFKGKNVKGMGQNPIKNISTITQTSNCSDLSNISIKHDELGPIQSFRRAT